MSLATIEEIITVLPHPNADRLELVQILGYQCVVPKNTYKPGDLIVFIRPDNVLPPDSWADEYRKYAPKRIRAIKIRNEWSEGIILNLDIVKSLLAVAKSSDSNNLSSTGGDKPQDCTDAVISPKWIPGEDVTEILGITHWEETDESDTRKGLPHGIPITDEDRYTNLRKLQYGDTVDVTLKIDGQSWSAYYHVEKDEFGVMGRRITYPLDTENFYTAHVKRYNVEEKLKKFCKENGVSLCIRGESYGEGIQKSKHNPHAKLPKALAIFSVYVIDTGNHAYREDKFYFPKVCQALDLPMVPILEEGVPLTQELIQKYAVELNEIDGQPFEGVVIKGKNFSFKIINKSYDSRK